MMWGVRVARILRVSLTKHMAKNRLLALKSDFINQEMSNELLPSSIIIMAAIILLQD